MKRLAYILLLPLCFGTTSAAPSLQQDRVICLKPDEKIIVRNRCRYPQTRVDAELLQTLFSDSLGTSAATGPQGPTGSQGPQGPQGETGQEGPRGPGGGEIVGSIPGCSSLEHTSYRVAIEGTNFISSLGSNRSFSIYHVPAGTYTLTSLQFGNAIGSVQVVVADDQITDVGTALPSGDCGLS